jgi:hypothetical protein
MFFVFNFFLAAAFFNFAKYIRLVSKTTCTFFGFGSGTSKRLFTLLNVRPPLRTFLVCCASAFTIFLYGYEQKQKSLSGRFTLCPIMHYNDVQCEHRPVPHDVIERGVQRKVRSQFGMSFFEGSKHDLMFGFEFNI